MELYVPVVDQRCKHRIYAHYQRIKCEINDRIRFASSVLSGVLEGDRTGGRSTLPIVEVRAVGVYHQIAWLSRFSSVSLCSQIILAS